MTDDMHPPADAGTAPHPWPGLETVHDAEAWIDLYNRDLQQLAGNRNPRGHGICFHLAAGGDIYLHTNMDGDILLDVTPDAQWTAPVLSAATHVQDPGTRLWMLPGDVLIQLLLGISSLVESTSIVLDHEFRARKY